MATASRMACDVLHRRATRSWPKALGNRLYGSLLRTFGIKPPASESRPWASAEYVRADVGKGPASGQAPASARRANLAARDRRAACQVFAAVGRFLSEPPLVHRAGVNSSRRQRSSSVSIRPSNIHRPNIHRPNIHRAHIHRPKSRPLRTEMPCDGSISDLHRGPGGLTCPCRPCRPYPACRPAPNPFSPASRRPWPRW